uniref:TNase-like domain-containing protein n=2 Tax=Chaetoceros debilis TaxID=122233 RepID=A0A7S3Q8J6_9STRA|mmetsp:Transcript_19397/g.29370  ORF Transcript_19397/g.29370 Transcript_19397/m.29370 type:complete len:242 (+) Transcript_19397:179-904(+)|eukprot:CAMPEP_0194106026 /NCGR_PEP_ID=MMETSP0150-20130528/6134_1 /TAXON_ID=122233 /ORGANISM="Chaetoceros debilis, Strain MM31A-1" /LENGTH=241 /DNA_ID=CAMNT_0038794069 /DNA_START=78 /DNA_END=803 /DNA_ORIENTATION=+
MKVPFVNPAINAAVSIFAASSFQIFTPQPLLAAPTFPPPVQIQQYNTAVDIPQEMFQNHASIYGRVERVADGDTFRIRHIPNYPIQTTSEYKGKLSEYTMPIRLYAIDCPEVGKNGNPSMPAADDAKEWTRALVNGKVVKVTLLQKDQYNRVLGEVTTTTSSAAAAIGTDLSIGLAHNGYATMYKGAGAEYDGHKDQIAREVQWAKDHRVGMWITENVQTPAEYKREMKAKAKTAAGSSGA